MKVRHGFVSNSSSSSFIVNKSDIFQIRHMPKMLKDPKTLIVPHIFGGEIQFGRQRENYTDFGSRLNWAFLQTSYLRKAWERYQAGDKHYNENWYTPERIAFMDKHHNDIEKLERVLCKELDINRVNWMLVGEYDFDEWSKLDNDQCYGDSPSKMAGYIDHQSLWCENGRTQEEYESIFEDDEAIFRWLFGVENYIANRSDEYEDMSELEVDHRFDYDYYSLYWNEWDHPEKFDKHGELFD